MCKYLWESLEFRPGKGKAVLRKCLAPAALPSCSLSCLASQEQHASHAPPHLESIHSPVKFMPCSLLEPVQRLEPKLPEKTATSPPSSPLSDALSGVEQIWGEPSSKTRCDAEPPMEAASWDPAETSTLLLPPRGPCGLGGTVNLILSIGKKGEKKKAQLQASSERPGEEALPAVRGMVGGSGRTTGERPHSQGSSLELCPSRLGGWEGCGVSPQAETPPGHFQVCCWNCVSLRRGAFGHADAA